MTDVAFESFRDWLITTIAALNEMEQEEETVKVTINPAGDVIFDVEDIRDAVAFATQLREPTLAAKALIGLNPKSTRQVSNNLSPALAEVYEHLVDNGDGWKATELAVAFNTKAPAMDQRLRALRKKGLVVNVGNGIWKAAK